MDDILFSRCAVANQLLTSGNESGARDTVIQILDYCSNQNISVPPLVNALVRSVGLYPYLSGKLSWDERLLQRAYSTDAGNKEVVLHREQAVVLKKLLKGDSFALSAPTSFGKSFIMDAFVSLKRPKNVLIVVPTIALADEMRRRLNNKFGSSHKIITTTEDPPSERGNIFIFPQERAISYADKIHDLDLLIVDEFYKAGQDFDKDRSGALIRAIIKFSEKAKQRYFLAPNITGLKENQFTKGMEFLRIDFNTVFLEKHELYRKIKQSSEKQGMLIEILKSTNEKTLVYAANYPGIAEVSNILLEELEKSSDSTLLKNFRSWLITNYGNNWQLPRLVTRGVGVHNGQLHRSLSQIQIRLFEEAKGLKILISTSSIIEGVNTSAQNVVLWKSKNGRFKLTDFDYKNIIGRGGRMLKHFVGKIYILEKPPEEGDNQLEIDLPDTLLGLPEIQSDVSMNSDQRAKAEQFNHEMRALLGGKSLETLIASHPLQTSNSALIKKIAFEVRNNPTNWSGISYLNSENPDDWERTLYNIIALDPGGWDIKWSKFVTFVKVISKNWKKSIPELLVELESSEIDLDLFFKLERNVTFKLATLIGDVNVMTKALLDDSSDASSFVFKASHAFLPPIVFELEEYGLPRMLSRKIHLAGVIDFEAKDLTLGRAIELLIERSHYVLSRKVDQIDNFDVYVFEYFLSGVISPHPPSLDS